MSIATLKKKTQTQYNNMSVGSKTGFSLNGTHRSQGYVGQTMLSRSLPRTLMKGNVMKGHGGCCGKFPIFPIVQSAVISTNNVNIVKPSVLTTSGMLDTNYRWIRRPYPYAVVKPDMNTNLNDQGDYITKLAKDTVATSCHVKKTVDFAKKKCANLDAYSNTVVCNYTKPETEYVAMSGGEYILKLHSKCSAVDVKNVKSNTRNTPFACN